MVKFGEKNPLGKTGELSILQQKNQKGTGWKNLTEAANPNLVFEGYKHLSVVSFTDSELSLYSHSEDFISSKTVYYRNYLKNEIIGLRKVVRVLKKEDLIYLLLDRNVGFTITESIDIKEAIDK